MRKTEARIQGEGDYEAAKRYDKSSREFVESGKVGPAAKAAKPAGKREAAELLAAERKGLSHSKGEALADRGSTLAEQAHEPDATPKRAPGTDPA